jgi:hypothetical protein
MSQQACSVLSYNLSLSGLLILNNPHAQGIPTKNINNPISIITNEEICKSRPVVSSPEKKYIAEL